MNRVASRYERGGDDVRNVQIGEPDRAGTDAKRFVRLAHVQRLTIRLGEDCNRKHAEFLACTVDAKCDLAAIGDQNFSEDGPFLFQPRSTRKSGCPYSTAAPSALAIVTMRPAPKL